MDCSTRPKRQAKGKTDKTCLLELPKKAGFVQHYHLTDI